MQVQFDFTIDDLIDVGERTLSRSLVLRNMRRGGALAAAVGAAAIVFLAAPLPATAKLVVAALAGAVGGAIYQPVRRSLVQKRLRDFWRERLGGDGPFSCKVDLTAEGVTTHQFSTATSIPWSEVIAIHENPDCVEISARSGGLIVVRDRAFASPGEKKRFVEIARSFLPQGLHRIEGGGPARG